MPLPAFPLFRFLLLFVLVVFSIFAVGVRERRGRRRGRKKGGGQGRGERLKASVELEGQAFGDQESPLQITDLGREGGRGGGREGRVCECLEMCA